MRVHTAALEGLGFLRLLQSVRSMVPTEFRKLGSSIVRQCVPLQTTSSRVLYLDIEKFHFKCIGSDSLILQRAFERYTEDTLAVCAQLQHPQALNLRAALAMLTVYTYKEESKSCRFKTHC